MCTHQDLQWNHSSAELQYDTAVLTDVCLVEVNEKAFANLALMCYYLIRRRTRATAQVALI